MCVVLVDQYLIIVYILTWSFTLSIRDIVNFFHNLHICTFIATTKQLSINVECPNFP